MADDPHDPGFLNAPAHPDPAEGIPTQQAEGAVHLDPRGADERTARFGHRVPRPELVLEAVSGQPRRDQQRPVHVVQIEQVLHALLALAGLFVSAEIGGEGLLEHQGNALSHDTDGVYGVHKGLHRRLQQISLTKRNHVKSTSLVAYEFRFPVSARRSRTESTNSLPGYSSIPLLRH